MTDERPIGSGDPATTRSNGLHIERPIVPPSSIGMLGGGQLGQYALLAARRMGYRTVVLDPAADAPAGVIADEHLVAAFDDTDAVAQLGAQCALVTTEFENPPAATLEQLAAVTRVAPGPAAVAVCQDRIAEKSFLVAHDVPVGSYAVLDADGSSVDAVLDAVTGDAGLPADATAGGGVSGTWGGARESRFPAVLKTARLGYDGKGQLPVETPGDLAGAWDQLGHVACVLERRLDLSCELSVVVARSTDGQLAVYECCENHHVDGILELTVVPPRVPVEIASTARKCAAEIADALGFVGTLTVEFFVTGDELLVNELAPRPHNSGHWTLDAAVTDQFAQQIRAVAGLPLGSTQMTAPAVAMVNLLGDLWAAREPDWAAALVDPDVRLHLYGKHEPRPGRKMGHLTVTAATSDVAEHVARAAHRALR